MAQSLSSDQLYYFHNILGLPMCEEGRRLTAGQVEQAYRQKQWEASQDKTLHTNTSTMLSTFHRLHAAFTVLKSIALSASGDAEMAQINTARARWEQRKKEPDVFMAEGVNEVAMEEVRNMEDLDEYLARLERTFGGMKL